jgi:RNA polymerase sigma-70 factor, ECF subfamily
MDQVWVKEWVWNDGINNQTFSTRRPGIIRGFGVESSAERNYQFKLYYNCDMSEMEKFTDEMLVTKIRTQNRERYAELVKRYEDKLMRYATYILRDEQKARDAVQDSFIKAYINLNSFDVKKKFSSWMYRIVHNESMNSIKKNHKEVPLIQDMDFESDENIEHDFTKKEIVEKAHTCLGKMPIIYSEPLSLHYLEDKSYEEISDILRIPMGTVATRINRAKGIMKNICQKNK